MTTLLWALHYNIFGLFLVWYTWPRYADARHFRAVNCVFMQALWPVYVVLGLIFFVLDWVVDDDVGWSDFFSRAP